MRSSLINKHWSQTFLAVAAQFLQHGASIIILPIIVFSFSPEAIGLWYIIVSFQSGLFLMDMGFTNSFSRALAQAFSGVESLKEVGWLETENDKPNHSLVIRIIKRMKAFFMMTGFASFFIMLFGGILYFNFLDLREFNNNQINLICFLAAFAIAIQLFGQWVSACLIGAGLTYQNQISILVSRLIFLLFGLLSIFSGFGIFGLLVSNLVGNIVGFIYKFYAYSKNFPVFINKNIQVRSEPVLRIIWHNAWRIGLVGICTFFILRFGVLLLGSYEGAESAGTLGLLVQISTTLIAIASMPWQVGLKSLVNLKISRDTRALRSFALTNWAFSFFIAFIALFGFIILEFLGVFNGTQFEGIIFTNLFMVYCIILILELNHTLAGQFISASNYVPFLPSAVISALLIVIFSTFFVMQGWGIFGIILSQGFVQLMWNNWFWPYKVWTELYNHAKYD